ncbi:hypothetical protein ACQP3C_26600, partial [Escherichia coli]
SALSSCQRLSPDSSGSQWSVPHRSSSLWEQGEGGKLKAAALSWLEDVDWFLCRQVLFVLFFKKGFLCIALEPVLGFAL